MQRTNGLSAKALVLLRSVILLIAFSCGLHEVTASETPKQKACQSSKKTCAELMAAAPPILLHHFGPLLSAAVKRNFPPKEDVDRSEKDLLTLELWQAYAFYALHGNGMTAEKNLWFFTGDSPLVSLRHYQKIWESPNDHVFKLSKRPPAWCRATLVALCGEEPIVKLDEKLGF